MKMNKGALIMALLMAAHVCHAAVLPSGSRFDPRNQIVSYNPNEPPRESWRLNFLRKR